MLTRMSGASENPGGHSRGLETDATTSLAKPDPKREARGSGDKPIPTFVPQYVILHVRLHNA